MKLLFYLALVGVRIGMFIVMRRVYFGILHALEVLDEIVFGDITDDDSDSSEENVSSEDEW